MAKWLDELGQLTGEELFHLIGKLNEWTRDAERALTRQVYCDGPTAALSDMAGEMTELEIDARMQVARITVPMREAQSTVYQRRFARGQMVKRAG